MNNIYNGDRNPFEGINLELGNDPEALHDPDRYWNALNEHTQSMQGTQNSTINHRIGGGGFVLPAKVIVGIVAGLIVLGMAYPIIATIFAAIAAIFS